MKLRVAMLNMEQDQKRREQRRELVVEQFAAIDLEQTSAWIAPTVVSGLITVSPALEFTIE